MNFISVTEATGGKILVINLAYVMWLEPSTLVSGTVITMPEDTMLTVTETIDDIMAAIPNRD